MWAVTVYRGSVEWGAVSCAFDPLDSLSSRTVGLGALGRAADILAAEVSLVWIEKYGDAVDASGEGG